MKYILTKNEEPDVLAKKLAGKKIVLKKIVKISELDDITSKHKSSIEALDYAIGFCDSLLAKQFRINERTRLTMRRDLPYCFNNNMLANREYKPVGLNHEYSERVEYANYNHLNTVGWGVVEQYRQTIQYRHFKETVFVFGTEQLYRAGGIGYLFNDGSAPWNSKDNLINYTRVLKNIRGVL